ncbi:aminoglycoside phosphotransferase family protein [Agrococcus sp. HG114]|uniref:aminoglycoside phosphotransferase family protein n=1 Tax=Agrococcus sp. HG114 TaxID=2969757 RepID=UPI00215A1EB5|nr:aminoglycoside phosphotransferase family protein [Agrococcus sp. HG114]MCR8670179.1 aminoglycoside phosphotransferase family protein [Agrococcus sp. HG114]
MLENPAGVLMRLVSASGRELVDFAQKDVEPVSEGFIVGYACGVRTPDDTIERLTIYVNTSPSAPVDEHTVELLDATGRRLTAWVYPQDPALPSLPAVSYPEAAGVVLAKFGIAAEGASLRMESYRPGKRAVLQVETATERWFAKVVHPSLAATIHDLHERFRSALVPVPRSIGFSDAGLVLLGELPGVPAIDVFDRIDRVRFASGLDELTAHIAQVPVAVGARESLARRVEWYADRMEETAPVFARQTARLAARVRERYDATPVPRPVTIHGDLHLGQIFVADDDPSRITGILDIDTAGLGDPADDRGALFGHVVVSAVEREAGTASGVALSAFADELQAGWRGDARVGAIAATHLLGHALANAGRGDDRGAATAQRLLERAEAVLR